LAWILTVIRREQPQRCLKIDQVGPGWRTEGPRDRDRNHNGYLFMSHNFYTCLGFGVIVGWLLSGVATFLVLAIMHAVKRK
jgi:hypothetical protein